MIWFVQPFAEITARGDDETYPQNGDIVRVRYTGFVVPDPKDKKKKDDKPIVRNVGL